MHRGLWLLIGLQLRGWLRFGLRGLATVKGGTLALVGIVCLLSWLVGVFWRGSSLGYFAPSYLRVFGPPLLAGYCLLNLLITGGENALYFTPAEVGFLFPAPLSRRQLVGYKLASTALVGLGSALLMAGVFQAYAGSFLSALAGIALVLAFTYLFSAALQLVVSAVGAQLFRRGRRLVILILVVALPVAAAFARWQGGPDFLVTVLNGLLESTAWQVAMQPFAWFIEVFLARQLWPDLLLFASLSTLVNLVFLALVLTLDSLNLESVASSSARLYNRVQRLRGRPTAGEINSERSWLPVLPTPPWLGGVGPLVWRQLTTALRKPGRLVLLAVPFAFLLLGPLLTTPAEAGRSGQLSPLLVGGVLWVSIFLTALVPFDFRGDVDRMALLKTLPLPGWRLAVGQLAAPVLVVSLLQSVVLGLLHAVLPAPEEFSAPAVLFTLPFNFVLLGLENLLFLLFPVRVVGANPGAFQALGRDVLLTLARLVGLGLGAGGAAAAGYLTYFLAGGSLTAAVTVAWLMLAGVAALLVPLVVLAFDAFDVSRDVPA